MGADFRETRIRWPRGKIRGFLGSVPVHNFRPETEGHPFVSVLLSSTRMQLTISRFGTTICLSSLQLESGNDLRIRAERALRDFAEKYPNAKPQLLAWREDTLLARWQTPNDVKSRYANASILNNQLVVFNIAGNQYRLIVAIHYKSQIVHIRWFGTHAEYDRINAYEV